MEIRNGTLARRWRAHLRERPTETGAKKTSKRSGAVDNEDAREKYSNGRTSSENQSREPEPGGAASDTQTKRNPRCRKACGGTRVRTSRNKELRDRAREGFSARETAAKLRRSLRSRTETNKNETASGENLSGEPQLGKIEWRAGPKICEQSVCYGNPNRLHGLEHGSLLL
jgi:hypothetical protein